MTKTTDVQKLFETLSSQQKAMVLQKLQARQQNAQPARMNDEVALAVVDRKQPLQASLNQEHLWFLYQLEHNSAYHTFAPIELKQRLHVPTLERALTAIIQRHESLRTTFVPNAGVLRQVIAPASPVVLPVVDLTHVAQSERSMVAHQLAAEEVAQPFDLATGPLLRLRLLHFADDHYILFLNIHHIIVDGRSLAIFYQELTVLYQSYMTGSPSPLPALPLQHTDFAQWQRQWLQGERFEQQLAYWRNQLAGLPPLLELPTDAPRPAVQATEGAHYQFTLPATLVEALEGVSQQHGATLFMTLLATFNILLSRYSHQEDIAVGTPVANRADQNLEPIIGFFANTLTLRTDLAGDPTFAELLARVKQTTLAAVAHQETPFGEVVKALCPQRNLSHQPLFQVMFAFHSYSILPDATPALAFSYFEHPQTRAMFDLTLECFRRGNVLQCQLEYSTTLFQQATIERMGDHFATLLHAIIANPAARISRLPLLPEDEQQVLLTWNNQTAPYLQATAIHHVIEQRAREHPDAPAVVYFRDGGCTKEHETNIAGTSTMQRATLSYGALNQQADQLAAYLQRCGVGPEKIVAVCLERSATILVAVLAILKAGGAYVALDPEYPPERLAWILADTQATVLLTEASLVERFPPPAEQTTLAQVVCLDREWTAIANCEHRLQLVAVTTDSLAYVIYTSGSTGHPKGVMGTHRNLLNLLQIAQNAHGIYQADNILQMANFAFSVFVADWVRGLGTGATLVICPRPCLLLPKALHELIENEAITCGDFVPAVLRPLVQQMRAQGKKLTKMRLLIVGSDSWHTQEYAAFRSVCGAATRLINAYGMTETTVDSCWFEQTAQPLMTNELMPIGRPFANVQVYIFDENRQLAPIGVPGELYIGGLGVARGYLNQPALTCEKFVANPFGNDILYRTGDRARYQANGLIDFLGRVDNQVKLRGFRIELGEIEATLLQHPQVQQAIVLLTEQAGEKQLVAYLVLRDGLALLEAEQATTVHPYRAFLQARLPAYMVPAFFVVLEHLPLTANGKIDRRALPKPGIETGTEAWVAPRSALEKTLATLWMQTLKLEKLSVSANFFEMGGHSLLAAQIVQQIQQELGHALPIATLFQNPTIAQLAAVLEHPPAEPAWSVLVPLQPKGKRLPFFCVHGIGGDIINYYPLAQALGPEQPFYGLRAVGLDGHQTPCTDLATMASLYVAAIRQIQIHSPYLIGGHSFGGEVAFEIVRQLQQQGETVAWLILLDSYAPGTLPTHALDGREPKLFSEAAYYISAALGAPLRLTPEELSGIPPEQWSDYLVKLMQQTGAFAQTDLSYLAIENALRVCQANLQMDYRPTTQLTVPTVLLHAETVPPELLPLQKDELGWRAFISSSIETKSIPGDHFMMLHTPYVQTVVRHLQTYFNAIQQPIGK